jgi:hypothetical protein
VLEESLIQADERTQNIRRKVDWVFLAFLSHPVKFRREYHHFSLGSGRNGECGLDSKSLIEDEVTVGLSTEARWSSRRESQKELSCLEPG